MSDKDIFKELLVEGLIGASLDALISKNKNHDGSIGAIAGAVIVATYNANQNAQKTNVPFCVVEKGSLYRVNPNGTKDFIRNINSPIQLPKKFQLK